MKAGAGSFITVLGAGLLAWAGLAGAAERPDMSRYERDLLGDVHKAIEARDCARAIAKLNDGLGRKFPDIYIMAGVMYEQGLCLKASWERAERMYQLAHDAGHGAGRLRLVAGLAHQRRDPAAALWWASRREVSMLPPFCQVGVAGGVTDDPDAFVTTLRSWPAGKVAHCTYVVGVMAAMASEIEYPSVALDYAMSANLSLQFVPAAGRIDWTLVDVTLEEMVGLVDGDALRDRNARSVQNSFRRYVEGISSGVLKRFDRPEGIQQDWLVSQDYRFTFRWR